MLLQRVQRVQRVQRPTVCQSRSLSLPHGFCQELIIQNIMMTIKN